MSQTFEESPVSDNSKMDISEATTSQESAGVSPVIDNDGGLMYNSSETNKTSETDEKKNTIKLDNNDDQYIFTNVGSSARDENDLLLSSGASPELIETNNKSNNRRTKTTTTITKKTDETNTRKLDNRLDNESSSSTPQTSSLIIHQNPPNKTFSKPPNVLRLGQQPTLQQNNQQQEQQNLSLNRSSELTLASSHPLMSPPGTDSNSDSEHSHQRNHNTTNHRFFSYFPDVVPESEPRYRLVPSPPSMTQDSDDFVNSYHRNNQHNYNRRNPQALIANNIDSTLDVTSVCSSVAEAVTTVKAPQKRRISVLRDASPDLLSSSSEPELSQFEATVEPNYQTVALISNNFNNRNLKMPSPKPLTTRRKIPVSSELLSDDMSSLDSISNHSFDDDIEPNLASLSPSSSVLDGFNDHNDDFDDLETPTNQPPDPIPQYTAEEERRDSRNWQKITLPDGKVREIDMKVIEPYKRVLSHGGYLKAGGHNAIVLFCACHLPDRSRKDYHYVMDNLFLYVVKTVEQLVTEDYVMIYLHGGSSRRNVPPFPWLKKCYQLLDRRLRKSLKNMYLVHPTFWLKSVVWMSRPFVSSKFWRKLVYVRSLEQLYSLVPVEKTSIPDKAKNYDSKYT